MCWLLLKPSLVLNSGSNGDDTRHLTGGWFLALELKFHSGLVLPSRLEFPKPEPRDPSNKPARLIDTYFKYELGFQTSHAVDLVYGLRSSVWDKYSKWSYHHAWNALYWTLEKIHTFRVWTEAKVNRWCWIPAQMELWNSQGRQGLLELELQLHSGLVLPPCLEFPKSEPRDPSTTPDALILTNKNHSFVGVEFRLNGDEA